jgi:hypothetical protein
MPDHIRTQCRDAATTLVTGLTTTGDRVTAARPRTRKIEASELAAGPVLLVYTNETNGELVSGQQGTRRSAEACELVVHAYAVGVGDVDKTLDTIEKEVRQALAGNVTLSGKAKDLYFTSSVKEDDPEAERPTWELVMTFTLEYHVRENALDAALA